jgi:glutathione S-transferase
VLDPFSTFYFLESIPVYQLYIANKNYSSWSLRPWVLLRQLGVQFEERLEPFETEDNFEKFRAFSPSGTVPCLMDGDTVVWDSLAIVEYLAEKEARVWPDNVRARAFARSANVEMHSSFSSLRNICPMNCSITVELSKLNAGLARDVSRVDELWREGLSRFGGGSAAGLTSVTGLLSKAACSSCNEGMGCGGNSRDLARRGA